MAEEKQPVQVETENTTSTTQTEKSKRVQNALKVGAILLLVVLIALLAYQIVAIVVTKNKYNELIDKINYYNELVLEDTQKEEIYKTKEWIIERARELGYWFPEDVIDTEHMKPLQ